MNAAHLHLALNHIPVVGVFLGFLLLVFALMGKKEDWIKAAWVLFIFSACACIPVYLSGEGAEELLEKFPGFSEALIAPHEAMAFYGLIGVLVLGAFSLLGFFLFRGKAVTAWALNLTLILSILAAATLGYTALLGGEINHPEIRKGFQVPVDH